ncbi:MAG: tetratricopeptide repeat protein [Thermodesulfobacteriota bacterium]
MTEDDIPCVEAGGRERNKLGAFIFLLLLVFFLVLSYGRNIVWINELSAWKDVEVKSPRKQRVFNSIGNAYLNMNRLDEAETAFRAALRIEGTEMFGLHNNLGVVYYRRGMTDRAIAEYLSVIKNSPDFLAARQNLGAAYERLGRLDEAIKEYDRILSLEPDYGTDWQYAEVYYSRGNAYAMKGLFNKAIEDYEAALKKRPDHVMAGNNLARSNLELGRLDIAEDELKKIIVFYPDYVNARYNMGLVYVKKGMPEEALAHFEKALALDSRHDKARLAIKEIKESLTRQVEKAP